MEIIKDKEYYIDKYKTLWDSLCKQEKCFGSSDPENNASIYFEDNADATEVAGFYLSNYGEDAYNKWKENTKEIKLSKQDKIVEEILTFIMGA